MASETTRNRQMEYARFGLLAVAILFGAWAAARVVGYFVGPARAEEAVTQALARNAGPSNETETPFDKAREIAETLKKKNLFTLEPPKEHPVKQIDGILGAEVLVGDKWYKVGEKIGEATILSIEPTRVTVEWDGQKKVFSPLGGDDNGPPEGPRLREPGGPSRAERRRPSSDIAAPTLPGPVEVSPVADDPLAWMGVDLPAGLRAKLLERWNSASDEEKAKGMEEWNKMSDDQKQQAIRSMENM